jgi:CheY-like chemotaxis protein
VRSRVLVIEDDTSNRDLLEEFLRSEGCEVRTTGNGADALKLLETWTPSLILLDLRLPLMSGEEFAQRYRAESGPHAPIVVLSAAMDSEEGAERIGAVGRLEKPFDLDELLALVSRFSSPD